MKTLVKIDALKIAQGMKAILEEMASDRGVSQDDVSYPISAFEKMIVEEKQVSKKEAEMVTEQVINTGIIRWSLTDNAFVL